MPSACLRTSTVISFVALPSVVVTVITASPAPIAVTTPFSSTAAMLSSEELKTTLVSLGSAGIKVTSTFPLSPTQRYSLSKESSILSTTLITSTAI